MKRVSPKLQDRHPKICKQRRAALDFQDYIMTHFHRTLSLQFRLRPQGSCPEELNNDI